MKVSLLFLLFLLLLNSCKDGSDGADIEYREESHEETLKQTQEVFGGEQKEAVATPSREVDDYFQKLGEATCSDERIDLDKFFSVDGMLTALNSSGVTKSLSGREQRGFEKGFRKGVMRLETSLKQMRFDQHRILRTETIDEDERVVFVRLYNDAIGFTTQLRWWLIKTDEGLRAYDFEDLGVGLRTISFMGTLVKAGIGGSPEPWVEDLVGCVRVLRTVNIAEPKGVLKLEVPLLILRKHHLPKDVARFASSTYVAVLQIKGEFEASLMEIADSRKKGIQAPLHFYHEGSAFISLDRYEEALKAFEKHIEVLGADSDVLEFVSLCHLGLDQLEEGRKAAMDGLKDNPRSIGCLGCLAMTATPEEIGSGLLDEPIKVHAELGDVYEEVLNSLIYAEYWDQTKALISHLRKVGGYDDVASEAEVYLEESLEAAE